MKILQVNSAAQVGGAETVARQLREGCARAGHKSLMLAAHGKFFPWGRGIEPLYPRLLCRLDMSRFHTATERMFPRFDWTDRKLGRLAGSDWDVINVHNFHGDYARVATLGALARRKPVVWTFHGCWGFTGGCDHTSSCERYLDQCGQCPQIGRWSFLQVDDTREQLRSKMDHFRDAPFAIVSPSRWLAEKIKGSRVGSNWDTRVIPNGVAAHVFNAARKRDPALRRELGMDPEATVILLVNRNFKLETKGFSMAREALSAVPPRGIQAIFAGMNGEWAAAALPGLPSIAAGYVASRERLARLYEASDIFLFASPEENFPCAVLEAMSAACCVVATPTGGVAEQVEPGKSGLVARDISGAALTAALREALSRPGLLRTLGEAARERVMRFFSEETMVSRYLKLYDEVAGQLE